MSEKKKPAEDEKAEIKEEMSETADADAASDEDAVAAMQAELDKAKDQMLRALAEAENTRRRADRDRQEAAKYGAVGLARDLLSVADNLRRALESLPDEARAGDGWAKDLVTGVELIEKDFLDAFARHGVEKLEPLGEPFDHNFHQAMFELEDKEKPAGTVVQLLQPGYRLHDRLLRAAMVGVSKGGPKAVKSAQAGTEQDGDGNETD